LRQFESVTSRSGAGGKSSIRAMVISFLDFLGWRVPRGTGNPDHFSASLEPDR
jgi:hypothetical protein